MNVTLVLISVHSRPVLALLSIMHSPSVCLSITARTVFALLLTSSRQRTLFLLVTVPLRRVFNNDYNALSLSILLAIILFGFDNLIDGKGSHAKHALSDALDAFTQYIPRCSADGGLGIGQHLVTVISLSRSSIP